jgi:hypothetical protein
MKRDYEINENNEINENLIFSFYFVIPLHSHTHTLQRNQIRAGPKQKPKNVLTSASKQIKTARIA